MKKEPIFYDALELNDLKKGGLDKSNQNETSLIDNPNNQSMMLNQSLVNETATLQQLNADTQNERDVLQKREVMTIALKKGLLLFKNIKETPDITDESIREEIESRILIFSEQQDQYKHISRIRIMQSTKDILPILHSVIYKKQFCGSKTHPAIQLKSIIIKNSHFNGVVLKQILQLFKDTLESIVIEDSYPIGQSRIECLTHLFVKSNVKPKRLPLIKNLSLSLMNLSNDDIQVMINQQVQMNMNNNNQQLNNQNQENKSQIQNQQKDLQQQVYQSQQQGYQLQDFGQMQNAQNGQQEQQNNQFDDIAEQKYNEEKKTYTQIVEKIMEDFRLHLIMTENYFKNVIDLETKFLLRQITLQGIQQKVIIDQKCLTLREHFRYFKEFIKLNRNEIEVVLFVNIGRVDLYVFKEILVQLRRLKNIKRLCFVRFQAEQNSLSLIKNYLYWRKRELEEVYFIQCSMNDLDLKFLFQRDNLQISDFPYITRIIINDNPLITKEYLLPVLYTLEEWKTERVKNNIYKYPSELEIFEKESKYQKPYKLRKRPEIITEGGVICKENESFLIKYLTDFSQNSLILDYFPLDQALMQTVVLLFQLIRNSKSLCKISLRNTRFLNLHIPLRQESQQIHSFIDEIDLSENSFQGEQKLVNFFSHVNNTYVKKLRMQKMDFDDFDYHDLPVLLGLCSNLKVLDLSGTKGFVGFILVSVIENIPNIEELYMRNCELSNQNLSVLNQKLFEEATAAQEEHMKRVQENYAFSMVQDEKKYLLENLKIIDVSENRDMGSCVVDFLIYLNVLSCHSNMKICLENIDLNEEQIQFFLKIFEEQRLSNIEIINLSKNYLERINTQLLSKFLIALVRENKKHLKEIILADTYLTVDQLRLIDKDVLDKSKLGNIENFDISGVGQLCLQELCFRGIFTNLSMSAKTVTALVWNNISLNTIQGIDLSVLISKFYMLEKFDISNNLYLSEKQIKEIVGGLGTLKHLTEFKMQNMGFNQQQMTCLVDALMGRVSTASSKYTIDEDFAEESTFQSLQILDMSGNKFGDEYQWKRFFYVVLSNQYHKLTTLVLQNIHMDDSIALNLIAVINERHQHLKIQSIDISHNNGTSVSDSILVQLIESFSKLKNLRKLYCRNVSLNAYKIQAICALILSNQMELVDISENGPTNSSIQVSDPSQTKLVSEGVYIPSQSLTNLFGCINGSFTYEHLQKILKQQQLLDDPSRQFDIVADDENGQKCPSIKKSNIVKLNLSHNAQLTYYDFKKIIKSINYIGSSNICHLTIQNCQLNVKLELLNQFLENKINQLYYLDVSHNTIHSNQSSQKFLEIISRKFSSHLEYLDISYTDFTDDELYYLSHTLAEQFLSLNYVNYSGIQHIQPKCLQSILTGLTLASQISLETLVIRDLKIGNSQLY